MNNESSQESTISCDTRMTRGEFLKKLLAPSVAIGAALVAPKVVDKFILPAQAAPQTSLKAKGLKKSGPWVTRR